LENPASSISSNRKTKYVRNRHELEENARIALLQSFSSKSSSQVTNSLTIALIIFAFVTAFEPFKDFMGNRVLLKLNDWTFSSSMLCNIIFWVLLSFIVAFGLRIVSRILYWSILSGVVLTADMASVETMKAHEEKSRNKAAEKKLKEMGYLLQERELDSPPFYMARLSLACRDWYEVTYKKRLISLSYYGRKEILIVVSLISVVPNVLILLKIF
jgi:hypothetical protein